MGDNPVAESYDASGDDIFTSLTIASRESYNCLKTSGAYRISCAIAAFEKYFFRRVPAFKHLIYPWVNWDWDYDAYVYKFYNPKNGIKIRGKIKKSSQDGTIGALWEH